MDHKNLLFFRGWQKQCMKQVGNKKEEKKMQWPFEQGRVQLIVLRQDLNWQSKLNWPLTEASRNSEHCDTDNLCLGPSANFHPFISSQNLTVTPHPTIPPCWRNHKASNTWTHTDLKSQTPSGYRRKEQK